MQASHSISPAVSLPTRRPRTRRIYVLAFFFTVLLGLYSLFSPQIHQEIKDWKLRHYIFEQLKTLPKISKADLALLEQLDARNKKKMAGLFAKFIHDPDPKVRLVCIDFLGEIGMANLDEAIPALISASQNDPDGDNRAYALVALEDIKAPPERILDALCRALQDPHELVCLEAIRIIQEFCIKEAKPFVIPLLSHKNLQIRENSIGILPSIEARETIPTLIQIYESDPNTDIRFAAVMALGAFQSKEALPVYLKALYEGDRFLIWTLDALKEFNYLKETVPHLKKILASTVDDKIRLYICAGLIDAGGEAETVLPVLTEIFLKEKKTANSLSFPLNLFIALGKEAEKARSILTEAFHDPSFPYKDSASVALYRIDPNPTHRQYILDILANPDQGLVIYSTLSKLREYHVDLNPFRESILSLTEASDRELRRDILEFLPLLHPKEPILKRIQASLKDEEKMVRRGAIKQWISLQPDQAGKILRELFDSPQRDLQMDAIWGVGQLGKESSYREEAIRVLEEFRKHPEKRLQKIAQFHWEKCVHQSWSHRSYLVEEEEEEVELE